MSINPRNLALIGAGYWGKNLARNFNALGALHTICDLDERILASYSEGYDNVLKTTSLDAVFDNKCISAIAIAAPAVRHYELVKKALLCGKNVFVEKPLALREADGKELAELAEKTGLVLMVGHILQYHPCIEKLQSLIASGELGKLYYITSNRLNLGKFRREENALWSFAPHDLSVILSLAGNRLPEQVQCTGEAYLTKGVPDTTLTTLRFSGGLRAHVYVSWLNPFKEQKLTVVGSEGMAVFDDTRPWREKLIIHRYPVTWADGQIPTPSKEVGQPVPVSESEPLRSECAHFLECCRESRKPRTDAPEGLRVLQILEAAQASLDRDGAAVVPGKSNAIGSTYFAHPTAVIDQGATIGNGVKVWHFSHVMNGAEIGENCSLGQNVVVSPGAKLGRNVKVQNNVSIYTGVTCEDDVFLGPSCVFTNVSNPRSEVNRKNLYEETTLQKGVTIGANATIVCGVTIGRFAFISAGAVVTKSVPDYALMVGVPARRKGWMSRHGHVLKSGSNGIMVCPESRLRYMLTGHETLKCIDLSEDASLPPELGVGQQSYRTFKSQTP